jgi:hypothetical protein
MNKSIKYNCRTVCAILVLTLLIVIASSSCKSGYTLSPRTIQIEGEQPDLFDTRYDLECVPGPQGTTGLYTKSLTPGGFCDMQGKVAQAANYKISGGIGGDLV